MVDETDEDAGWDLSLLLAFMNSLAESSRSMPGAPKPEPLAAPCDLLGVREGGPPSPPGEPTLPAKLDDDILLKV